LQIKKLRLDQTAKNNEQDAPIEGEAVLLDRNSLLNKILNKPQ